MGLGLHFKTNDRQRKPGYLFHLHLNFKNPISQITPKPIKTPQNHQNHFDTDFDKTPILRHFHHFSHHQ